MTTLKVRDVRPGEYFRNKTLCLQDLAALEREVLRRLLVGLDPGEVFTVSVDIRVEIDVLEGEGDGGEPVQAG